jgi:hypothetical protein
MPMQFTVTWPAPSSVQAAGTQPPPPFLRAGTTQAHDGLAAHAGGIGAQLK